MDTKERQWTVKEILRGKTLPFIALSAFFTYSINNGANKLLTHWLNINNTTMMRQNYSFGIVGAIFVIPAVLLSLGILKIVLKTKSVFIPVSNDPFLEDEAKRIESQEKQFKWYSVYGIVLGYFFLGTMVNLGRNKWLKYVAASDKLQDNIYLETAGYSAIMFTCLISTILAVMVVNKIMIKKTGTNKDLLKDINQGRYESKFSNTQEKNETIKLLQVGRLGSVKSALTYLKIQRWLTTIGKGSIFITSLIFVFTFGVINFIGDSMIEAIRNTFVTGNSGFSPEDARAKKQAKSDATWDANQKQKEANHSFNQAAKQAAYNSNTHHSTTKNNHFINKQNEANEAKRKARNL